MNPEKQDLSLLPLYEPTVLLDTDLSETETAARASLLLTPSAIEAQLKVLMQKSGHNETMSQKLKLQTLQSFVIRGLYRMLDILKEEFVDKLSQFNLVDQLIKLLVEAVDSNEKLNGKDLLSSSIHETRLGMLRQAIMSSSELSLAQIKTLNNHVIYAAQILQDSKTIQFIAKAGRLAQPEEIFFFNIKSRIFGS